MSAEFEKNVYKEFDKIDEKFDKIDERFDKIDERFEKVDNRIDKFQKDVYEKFDKVDERFEKVDERFEKIDKRLDEHDKKFDNIEHILADIQRSIVLIEDQVMVKIPALFDGYAMHQEKQEIQEESINSLNRKVEDHDIRISILEQQSV